MSSRRLTPFTLVAFVLCALLLAGCTTPVKRPPVAKSSLPAGDGWHALRLQFARPAPDATSWHLDSLAAAELFAPALPLLPPNTVWRFHRRAALDEAGHRFSFIYYASAAEATAFVQAVTANPRLEEMKTAGLIRAIHIDTPADPSFSASSDANWSEPLQAAWPWFAQGVSQTWLALVRHYAEQNGEDLPEDIEALTEHYRNVHERVTEHWQNEGQHAFLHHLNALFGYAPLIIREQRMLQF